MTLSKEELSGLVERVRGLKGADRYSDCHLWVLAQGGDARMRVCDSSTKDFVWERGIDGFWVRAVVPFRSVPRYTGSVDAALALVERVQPGWGVETVKPAGGGKASCRIYPGSSLAANASRTAFGSAPTPPLAIILALLLSLQSQEPTP